MKRHVTQALLPGEKEAQLLDLGKVFFSNKSVRCLFCFSITTIYSVYFTSLQVNHAVSVCNIGNTQ